MAEQSHAQQDSFNLQQTMFAFMMQAMRDVHDTDLLEDDVGLIEGLLSPYHDERYTEEIEKIRKMHRKNMSWAWDAKLNTYDGGKTDAVRKRRADSIFKELMMLARRKGFLPAEAISHTLGEEF